MVTANEYHKGVLRADGVMAKSDFSNQMRFTVNHTAGTYTIGTLPANSILEQVILRVSEAFDCTLDLGNAGGASAYVPNATFVKTIIATPSPLVIGDFIATDTDLKLVIGAGGTTGAGVLWVIWRPMR